MQRRLKRWTIVVVLALVSIAALVAAELPYLPFVHGSTADEVERLAGWLELQPGTRVADFGDAAAGAGLSNVKVIPGARSSTHLPEGCCDALYSRFVYHHLTDAAAINADIFRALRPGGRLVIIDFEPHGIMNWIHRPETADRHGGHGSPKETVLKEVTAAGFQVLRGPEFWRGRTYGVLFRRP